MFAFRNCGGVGKLSKSQRAKKARVLAEALERRQLLSAGDPDPSFGTNGATLLSFQGPLIDAGYSVTVDNQGRTVVAGNSYVHSMQSVIAVARYLPNGTLDTGFGNGGQVIVSAGFQDSASGVTTDSSGRVIVVGQTFAAYDPYYRTGDFLVARLNADGSMDTSFNGTGEAIVDFAGGSDYASKAVIQPDGRILVAGYGSGEMAIARFNTNGSLDTTFGSGTGKVMTNVSSGSAALAMSLDSSGRIVVTGSAYTGHNNTAVVRYNADGTLDTSFGTGGIVTTAVTNNINEGTALDFTSTGQIIVAGTGQTFNSSTYTYPNGYDIEVERYNLNGTLDTSFGAGGFETIDYASKNQYVSSVRVLSSGNILLAGYDASAAGHYESMAVRLTPSGALDTSYQGTGRAAVVLGQFITSTIAADGTVTEAGAPGDNGSSFAVARTTSQGTVDTSFGNQGLVTTDFVGSMASTGNALAVGADGKTIIVGDASQNTGNVFAVARVNTDGTPDSTFGTNGVTTISFNGVDDRATAVAIQPDGKIVVAGYTNSGTSSVPNYDFAVVRLNADGSVDSSFGNYGTVVIDQLLQYPSYQMTQDYAYGVALAPDGRVVIAGFTSQHLNGFNVMAIARLTSTGALDTSLNGTGRADVPGGQYSAIAFSVAVDSSGRMVLGGYAQPTSGAWGFYLARLSTSGTMDNTFGTSGATFSALGGNSSVLHSIAIQPDGRIDAGGYASVSGYENFAVARYTVNGVLDPSFNTSGYALMNISSAGVGAVVPLSDGGILASGGVGKVTLAKFTSTGALDASFGSGGIAASNFSQFSISALNFPPVIAVRPDGAVVTTCTPTAQPGTGFVAMVGQFQGNTPPATGSVTGTVFMDFNGNGVQDPTDTAGLAGITVYLDLNGDGTLDGNDPRAVTTSTGAFVFSGLAPGQYTVREILSSSSFYASSPNGLSETVTVSTTAVPTVLFGVAQYSSVSGTIYNDLVGNGISTGNPPLAGVTVFLDLNGNGVLDPGEPSAVSDSSGNYTLSNLRGGTFEVREVVPPGSVLTQPTIGGAPGYYTVNLGFLSFGNENYGNFLLGTASGIVFSDTNGNGVQDAGEPGLAGWTVFADVNSTGVLAGNDPSAVTNSNGNYTITGLLPGQDTFRLVPQTGMTVETTPPSAQIYSGSTLSFSFAVKQLPASISGVEYEDGNGDGTFGAADATVAGLQVYIDSNNNGSLDAGEPVTTTNLYGAYSFTNLQPGTYVLRQAPISYWLQTEPAGGGARTVIVSAGQSLTGQNFGQAPGATIMGTVFADANHNGVQDSGEPGLANVTVYLDNNGNGVDESYEPSVLTSASGQFSLGPLAAGTYQLRQILPRNYSTGSPSSGYLSVTLSTGQTASGLVFADVPVTVSIVQRTGTTIGTAGSYGNSGNTIAKATDGNLSTYFDGPTANGDWVGLDLGSAGAIATQVKYASRSGWASRMNGGIFQASNSAAFTSGVVNLYIISANANPSSTSLTTQTLANSTAYRYYRYLGPAASYGDVSEVQFYGTAAGSKLAFTQAPSNTLTGVPIDSSAGVQVLVEDNSVNVVADGSTVTLTLHTGNFSTGSSTVSATAVNGVATFSNLMITTSGTYTLTASDGTLTSSTSASFTVSLPVPAWLSTSSAAAWNSSTHTLTVTGAATITADPGSDEPIITASGSSAQLTIDAPPGRQFHTGGLNLANGASAKLLSSAAGPTVLEIAAGANNLSISSTSTLDLEQGDLVVSGGNLSAISALIATAYANGTWKGAGITSSSAATDTRHLTAVGAISNAGTGSSPIYTIFGVDTSVVATDILIKCTYYGDTNLDGKVDGSDYSLIDSAYLYNKTHPSSPLTGWFNGDFNYDNVVNGSDYTLIDNAFNTQGARLAAEILVKTADATARTISAHTSTQAAQVAPSAISSSDIDQKKRKKLLET